MKKASIFILTLLFAFSLTACGSGNKENALPKEGVIEKSDGDSSTSDAESIAKGL